VRVRLKVSVRRWVSPHFFRGEGREVAEKGAGLTPAPSLPDTFNRTRLVTQLIAHFAIRGREAMDKVGDEVDLGRNRSCRL
jgi:hypothetical protein